MDLSDPQTAAASSSSDSVSSASSSSSSSSTSSSTYVPSSEVLLARLRALAAKNISQTQAVRTTQPLPANANENTESSSPPSSSSVSIPVTSPPRLRLADVVSGVLPRRPAPLSVEDRLRHAVRRANLQVKNPSAISLPPLSSSSAAAARQAAPLPGSTDDEPPFPVKKKKQTYWQDYDEEDEAQLPEVRDDEIGLTGVPVHTTAIENVDEKDIVEKKPYPVEQKEIATIPVEQLLPLRRVPPSLVTDGSLGSSSSAIVKSDIPVRSPMQARETFVESKLTGKFIRIPGATLIELQSSTDAAVAKSVEDAFGATSSESLSGVRLSPESSEDLIDLVQDFQSRMSFISLLASGFLMGLALFQLLIKSNSSSDSNFLQTYSPLAQSLRLSIFVLLSLVLPLTLWRFIMQRLKPDGNEEPLLQTHTTIFGHLLQGLAALVYAIAYIATLVAVPTEDQIWSYYQAQNNWYNSYNPATNSYVSSSNSSAVSGPAIESSFFNDLSHFYDIIELRFACIIIAWLCYAAKYAAAESRVLSMYKKVDSGRAEQERRTVAANERQRRKRVAKMNEGVQGTLASTTSTSLQTSSR